MKASKMTRQNTDYIPSGTGQGYLWRNNDAKAYGWTEEEDELWFKYAMAHYLGHHDEAHEYAEAAKKIEVERKAQWRLDMMHEVYRDGAFSVRRMPSNYTVPRWIIFHEEEEIVTATTLKGAKNAIAFMNRKTA